ncbi:MAG: carbohydrate-binding protein [Bacteroidales bacterium]
MAFLPYLNKKILFFLLFVWSLESMGQNNVSRYWGIMDDVSFGDTNSISQLRKQFGKQPAFVSRILDWNAAGLNFPAAECDQIKAAGSIPFISIDLSISLSDILKGKSNTVLEQFGAKIHSFDSPVFIRWAREPNSDWNSWNGSKNPEGARIYTDAYRYVVDKITEAHPAKPIMLAETGCAPNGGDKAAWINDLFGSLKVNFTQIRAIIWNNRQTSADWRLSSPGSAATAFAAGLADSSCSKNIAGLESLHVNFPKYTRPVSEGFLRASGKKIVDGNNREVLLRGMGLGGWMLQEGYMLETGDFAGTQHEIKARIRDLVGQAGMEKFYDAWLANHVTKADIDTLARWGFNSVRPALHYNLFTLPAEEEPVGGRQTWLEKGFVMLDSLVSWCAANQMYVILDLHAAPGGQGRDNNISDRDPSKLSLWESAANRTKTIELWKRLAERYANNPWVGGYDLLNETNWDFENSGNQNGCSCQQNAPLLDLFKKIITAIRSKDTKHLIFIEGNCWSGNFNGLLPLTAFDNNLAFSFHRYWNRNDIGTIQEKLNIRDQYNIPLWMGESGENSNHWFAEAISLLETNDIGWSWWPEKKINSVVGPLTVIKTPEYEQLLRYWKNGGTKPDSAFAAAALMQIAENLKIGNCIIHYDVPDALFRQQLTSETKPFARNRVPGIFYAVDFDMGRNNFAYSDADFENSGGQGSTDWNLGWIYRNDGPDIEVCTDSVPYTNGYNISHIVKGEWLAYTFITDTTGVYNLTVRTASASGMGVFRIEIDGINVSGSIAVPHTGGYQRYIPINLKNLGLTAGWHKMIIYFEEGGFNVNSFAFNSPTGATGVPFSLLSAKTDDMGKQIVLTFNKPLSGFPASGSQFTLTVGSKTYVPDSVSFESINPPSLRLWFGSIFSDTDILKLSYNGNQITSGGGDILAPFTDVPVVNTIIPRLPIPGILEAENYSVNSGFGFETCSDTGGGQNAGWTDAGDYLEFPVRIAEKALYKVTYRYACNSGTSKAELFIIDDIMQSLHTVDFAATGGWQNWSSVTVSDSLPAGLKTIRITALTSGFNLNRIEFIKVPGTNDSTVVTKAGFRLYPNPAADFVIVEISNPNGKSRRLELMDMLGRILYKQDTPSTITAKCTVSTSGYLPGIYLIRVGDEQTLGTLPLLIKNMKP